MAIDTEFEYLSLEQAAALLDVHTATLRRAISEGALTATKGIGYGYKVKKEWLQTWVNSKIVNPKAADDSAGGGCGLDITKGRIIYDGNSAERLSTRMCDACIGCL